MNGQCQKWRIFQTVKSDGFMKWSQNRIVSHPAKQLIKIFDLLHTIFINWQASDIVTLPVCEWWTEWEVGLSNRFENFWKIFFLFTNYLQNNTLLVYFSHRGTNDLPRVLHLHTDLENSGRKYHLYIFAHSTHHLLGDLVCFRRP